MSLRDAGDEIGINYRTLARYCKKAKVEDLQPGATVPLFDIGYQKPRQVFTEQFEQELKDYLLLTRDFYYGLTPKEVRKLAFELATANSHKLSEIGTRGSRQEKTGTLHLRSATQPFLCISHNQQAIARATAFNKANVDALFDNLVDIYNRHNFQPCDIWSTDETGITTAQTTERIIGAKSKFRLLCRRNKEHVTVPGTISASGNSADFFGVSSCSYQGISTGASSSGSGGTGYRI
ncbi:transposase [Plakobranchus ocellatus]|uniref:Transposase n=1 Tax=Plakobranchus ocellatus TaxID=259542 RepID=A0AAV3Y4B6_9GAST|nr:transposase [Plakobranchus ocellatus]